MTERRQTDGRRSNGIAEEVKGFESMYQQMLEAKEAADQARVVAEQRDETLRTFVREVLDGYSTGVVGDIDGGWLQDRAIDLGLLVEGNVEDDEFFMADWLSVEAREAQVSDSGSLVSDGESIETLRSQLLVAEQRVKELEEKLARVEAMGDGNHSPTAASNEPAQTDIPTYPCEDPECYWCRVTSAVDADLDPGIRPLVALIRSLGYTTTESGDGVSKPPDERTFDGPHVVVLSRPDEIIHDARHLQVALDAHADPSLGWRVEASYAPNDATALLLVLPSHLHPFCKAGDA